MSERIAGFGRDTLARVDVRVDTRLEALVSRITDQRPFGAQQAGAVEGSA